MAENDRPNADSATLFEQETEVEVFLQDDEDEDVHICKRCNLAFTNVQKYLEHKVKHDNFRVKYRRSEVDRRMIMPQLVQKQVIKREPKEDVAVEEKENENSQKGRRGKRKKAVEVNEDLVIKEKPVYICSKCDRKFNREATLRRHIEYDHAENDEEEGEEGEEEQELEDVEYKPNKAEVKEMETEDIVEEAPVKKQKLSEEDKASRKFVCQVCGNRFKEINVLKIHMLTHTSRREYVCKYAGCTYAFKTKGSLKRHSRRHTGERPFPCEMCGRSFTESGALTRHLKSRVPCISKTDNDLPRYGKKWISTPKMAAAAAMAAVSPACTTTKSEMTTIVTEAGTSLAVISGPESDIMVQQSEREAVIEGLTLPGVVHVLEADMSGAEILHAEEEIGQDGIEQRGVEVIIDETGGSDVGLVDDDSIGQFVQSETEIALDQPTVCRVCKDDFLTVEALKIHLRTHLADSAFRCWLCHFVSDNKEQFIEHMYSQHNLQLKGTDPLNHMVTQTSEEDTDNIRDAQVAVKQLLDLPSEGADSEAGHGSFGNRLMYKCPVCLRKFRGNNYLRLHMRNHTGLRPHKCPECEKSFITKDTLNKHMTVHVEERNFKCGECGKLFKRLSHVREHLKIHSGTRPFACTICDKSFKTNNAMKVHLRTHTDILPYECNFCHRRFREKGSLLRHVRLHTGEKPYECKYCGRCFAEHGTLNRHLKAKVSCTEQLQELRDETVESEEAKDYPTVLAEFSSVVADTQQYIIPQEGEDDDDIAAEMDEAQQAAEFVVVQTDMEGEEIQNVEIITDTEGNTSMIEGVQVTEEYVVISDPAGDGMRILNSRTGETVAMVPVPKTADQNEIQNQTVMLTEETGVEAIAMAPVTELETDTTLEQALLQSDSHTSVEVTSYAVESDLEVVTENT